MCPIHKHLLGGLHDRRFFLGHLLIHSGGNERSHLFFVFGGLALLYGEVEQLHGMVAISLVGVTFGVLMLVALNEARKRRRDRAAKLQQQANPNSIPAREAA